MIEIKRRVSLPLTWADLKAAANNGALDTLIQSDDLIPFALKSGEKVAVRATQDGTGKLFFVLEDCMRDNRAMNTVHIKKDGWDACEMRKYLNTEVFALLPDELQAVIAPTTIVQIVNGRRMESKDKLFLLSMTQVFGKDYWSDVEPEDTQLDCFRRKKDRLKECGEYGLLWWWLRSPAGSWSSNFYVVNSDGGSSSENPVFGSNGVVFAFCIN